MRKKALVISGSFRLDGVTASVSEILRLRLSEKGCEVSVIYLADHEISPCDGCERPGTSCNYREHPCTKHDDMSKIIKAMIKADIIIYACPVHAFGTASLMQLFLERAGVGYLRFNRPLANKIGGAIVIGRKYSLGSVHDQVINNMLLNRMIVPGAGFPVLVHGNEATKSITDAEEITALNQLVERLIEVSNSIKDETFRKEWKNERILAMQVTEK